MMLLSCVSFWQFPKKVKKDKKKPVKEALVDTQYPAAKSSRYFRGNFTFQARVIVRSATEVKVNGKSNVI